MNENEQKTKEQQDQEERDRRNKLTLEELGKEYFAEFGGEEPEPQVEPEDEPVEEPSPKWQDIAVMPEKDPVEEQVKILIDVKQKVLTAQLELMELDRRTQRKRNMRKGGRPRNENRGIVRRIKGSQSIINYPVEIAKNYTLSDTAKGLFPLVATLSWLEGYMWISNSELCTCPSWSP